MKFSGIKKSLILLVLSLLSLEAFCQNDSYVKFNTVEYQTRHGIALSASEQVSFKIHINNIKHKFLITDKTGKVLYAQTTKEGSFQIINKEALTQLYFFDETAGKYISSYSNHDYKDFSIIRFANNIEATVSYKLLPLNSDMKNKHFVRFLCFSSMNLPDLAFSLSLEKLPPPNSITEPQTNITNQKERNILVSNDVYLSFKTFILAYKDKLNKNPKVRLVSNFTMEINIDFRERYFLDHKTTIIFLSELIDQLKIDKVNAEYLKLLYPIINNAKYALKYEGKQPRDPN